MCEGVKIVIEKNNPNGYFFLVLQSVFTLVFFTRVFYTGFFTRGFFTRGFFTRGFIYFY